MAAITIADVSFSVDATIQTLFSWLRQQPEVLFCEDGLPSAPCDCDDSTAQVLALLRALIHSPAVAAIREAAIDSDLTRCSQLRQIGSFCGSETDEEIVSWFRALPPWQREKESSAG